MTNQHDDEIPDGFGVPVSYNEIGDVEATRCAEPVNYVVPAIYSKEELRKQREERDK